MPIFIVPNYIFLLVGGKSCRKVDQFNYVFTNYPQDNNWTKMKQNQTYKKGQMLKGPALKSSGLYISVFQDRNNRGAVNMFKNMY